MESVLRRPVLVLNQQWQAVHVTDVERALVVLFRGKGQVVDPDDYSTHDWAAWMTRVPAEGAPVIRTARLRLACPEVIRFEQYNRVPAAAVTFNRGNLAKRDHGTCQYCGQQPGWKALTIDHVVPRSRGGATGWTNCVAACEACNSRKADRTPAEAGMKLRREPHRPEWRPFYAALGARVDRWGRFLGEIPHAKDEPA